MVHEPVLQKENTMAPELDLVKCTVNPMAGAGP